MKNLSENFIALNPGQRLFFAGLFLTSILIVSALFFWAVWPDISSLLGGGLIEGSGLAGLEILDESRLRGSLTEVIVRYAFVLSMTLLIIFLILKPLIEALLHNDAHLARMPGATTLEGQAILKETASGVSVEEAKVSAIENARKGLRDVVTKNPQGTANIIKVWLGGKGVLETNKLKGLNKAALIISNLGEDVAADLLKSLNPVEIRKIGLAITNFDNTSSETFFEVAGEFTERVALDIGPGDTGEYVKKIMINALGPEKGGAILKHISNKREGGGFEILRWVEPDVVAEFIKREHPQTIAVILASLAPEQAAQVLSFFDDGTRADAVIRLATMEPLAPAVMEELEESIGRNFSTMVCLEESRSLGGVRAAAEILNRTDSKTESDILYDIESRDSLLSSEIEEKMFIFADIINIDDRGIQKILKDISRDQLVLSLRTADNALKEKFFANMSERVRDMFRDEMDIRGPLKLSEVEKAQLEVVRVVRRLASEGEVTIMGEGADDIFV